MQKRTRGPSGRRKSQQIIFALAFAGTLASLSQVIITPLLAELPRLLNTSSAQAAWVVTITLLVGAVTTPISGRLGDMFGKRRILLVCMFLLAVGSTICALAPGAAWMLVGRGLQGCSFGAVSLGVALTRHAVSPPQVTTGIATISASLGLGGGIGLPLSAALVEWGSWRFMFLTCTILAVISLVVILAWVPRDATVTQPGSFDFLGATLLSTGIVGTLLLLTQVSVWGWFAVPTICVTLLTVASWVCWYRWEARTTVPLVNVRVVREPRQLLTNVASLCIGVGMYAASVITPLIFLTPERTGFGLGLGLMLTAVLLLPGGLVQLVLAPVSGKLIDNYGPKVTLICGAAIMTVGYAASFFSLREAWGLMLTSLVLRAGIGIAYSAMPVLVMHGVPVSDLAATNSFNSLMRSSGTAVGAALAGVGVAMFSMQLDGHEYITVAGAVFGYGVGVVAGILAVVLAAFIPVADMPRPLRR